MGQMKTVEVLMSAYNGEKYISEQLDSLLGQEGVRLQVFIRDDGSKDKTVSILEEYSMRDSRIAFYRGRNIGAAKSFLELVAKSPPADYYAFCDQDDVWDKDKLARAAAALDKTDCARPAMYYSNLRIVDEKLHFYRLSHSRPLVHQHKYCAMTDNLATGCTVVFNRAAASMIKGNLPGYCSMHDAWVYLVCMFFGTVVYDFRPHISYRQHAGNAIGTYLKKNSWGGLYRSFKRLFDRELQPRYHDALNFYQCYKECMDSQDAAKVLKLIHYKRSFRDRMKLLFDFDIRAYSIVRDAKYRVLIVLGIV